MIPYEILVYTLGGAILLLIVVSFLYFRVRKRLKNIESSESNLIHQAYFDELTTLPNREGISMIIDDQITRCERRDKVFFIVVVTIERPIEGTIVEAGNRLFNSIRSEDTVAHISKGVFVIVFNEYLEEANSGLIFNRIKQALRKEYIINKESSDTQKVSNVPFSLKVNTYPEKNTVDALMSAH